VQRLVVAAAAAMLILSGCKEDETRDLPCIRGPVDVAETAQDAGIDARQIITTGKDATHWRTDLDMVTSGEIGEHIRCDSV
jgi:hypothetical protein